MSVNKIINFFKLALIPIVTLGYSTASYGLSVNECLEKISTDPTFKTAINAVLTEHNITKYDNKQEHQQQLLCINKNDLLKPIANAILTICPKKLGDFFIKRDNDHDIQYDNYIIRFKPRQIFEHLNATIGILASLANYNSGQEISNAHGNGSILFSFCSESTEYFSDGFTDVHRSRYWLDTSTIETNDSNKSASNDTNPGMKIDNSLPSDHTTVHIDPIDLDLRLPETTTKKALFFPGLALSGSSNTTYLALGPTPRDTYEAMKKAANKPHFSACKNLKYYLVMIGFEDGGYNKKITNATPITDDNCKIEKVLILSTGIPVK